MITNRNFTNSVIKSLREHLATDDLEFFGSHLTGEADEYSDVDVCTRVGRPLNDESFNPLTAYVEKQERPLRQQQPIL